MEIKFANPSKEFSESTVDDTVCIEMIPPPEGIDRPVIISVALESDSSE